MLAKIDTVGELSKPNMRGSHRQRQLCNSGPDGFISSPKGVHPGGFSGGKCLLNGFSLGVGVLLLSDSSISISYLCP